jgi:hypothetical protein
MQLGTASPGSGKRTLPLDRTKVGNSRIPSVHEIRSRDRKGSTAAEANEDEAARAERGGHQPARQTSGWAGVP